MLAISYFTTLWLLCTSYFVASFLHPLTTRKPLIEYVSANRYFAITSDDGENICNSDEKSNPIDDNDDEEVSLEGFQRAQRKQQEKTKEEEIEIDGYFLRDVILDKWGYCFDVDFNRVDSFGFRELYLNILPFHLDGRRFRHETELDYLCHLQAVVEILQKYDQLDYILTQIEETKKKPRAGTVPIVAVPLRLDLTRKQVQEILAY